MGCDEAWGRFGSNSDARKRREEMQAGRAELDRREAERWRAEANFGVREDEPEPWHEDFPEPEWHKAKPTGEYTPSVPSTSEYIRRLIREKRDLTIKLEATAAELDHLEQRIRKQADEWASVGALPRANADRKGVQPYGNGRLDAYASCAQVLRDFLVPDVSNYRA